MNTNTSDHIANIKKFTLNVRKNILEKKYSGEKI